MYLIIDAMPKNKHDSIDDGLHANNRSYELYPDEYIFNKIANDKSINDIYLFIGAFIVFIGIVFSIAMMIKQCVRYYKTDDKIERSISIVSSNVLLRRESSIRRNSSIRDSCIPNRRSSLDIRFLMESRERRLSKSRLIPVTLQSI